MDTFKIRVVQSNGEKFQQAMTNDITLSIPDTENNNRKIHMGITGSDNYLSIDRNETIVSGNLHISGDAVLSNDVRIMGKLLDSDNNEYVKAPILSSSINNAAITPDKLFNVSGSPSANNVGVVLSHDPMIYNPIINDSLNITKQVDSDIFDVNDTLITVNTGKIHIGASNLTRSNYVTISDENMRIYGDLHIMGNLFDINGDIIGDNTELNIADGSILNKFIADNTLTLHKIEKVSGGGDHFVASLKPQIFAPSVGGGITFSQGPYKDHTGNITIGTTHIFDDSVTTKKLYEQAVTTEKIRDMSVTAAKLDDNCLYGRHLYMSDIEDDPDVIKIKNNNLTDDCIQTDNITDLAITTNKLDTDAVTTSKICRESVTEDKIHINAVTTTKIMNNNITPEKVSEYTGNGYTFVLQNDPEIKGSLAISGKLKGTRKATNIKYLELLSSSKSSFVYVDNTLTDMQLLIEYRQKLVEEGELYVDSDVNINGDTIIVGTLKGTRKATNIKYLELLSPSKSSFVYVDNTLTDMQLLIEYRQKLVEQG